MKKHISYIILAVAILLSLSFSVHAQSLPTITMDKPIKDMTISELQTKIAEILSVIQQLQALIAQLQGGEGGGVGVSCNFYRNLYPGTSGSDVKCLQQYLNNAGHTLASSGPGSPSNETIYYGSITRAAVKKWQDANNIEQGVWWGYFGPKSQAKYNELAGTGEQSPYAPPGGGTSEDKAGTYCGDGIAQRPSDQLIIEDCDGTDIRNKTCITQGYTGGTLLCSNDCSFNTSLCTGTGPDIPTSPTPPGPSTSCGDSIMQKPNSEGIYEVCDSTNLGTSTCSTYGYVGGTLSCSSTCLTFNTTNCITASGIGGGGGGAQTPVGPTCGDNTDNICPSGCTNSQDDDCSYCGDNVLQRPNDEGILEVCDNTKLDNQTCITKGFPGGTLSCSSTCLTFDTSSCTLPSPPNQAPILNTIGNKTINENQQLSFTVSGTDIDGDNLTYSVQNRPSGATFSSQTFTWTPSYTQSGTYDVIFTVSDGSLTDTETITITVNNINRDPILNPIGDKAVQQNNILTFTISGSDPDNDTLTYSIQNTPSGASFNASTRTFTWTPSNTGTYNTTFTVSDGSLTDTETITITVTSAPVPNNAPIANNQAISLDEDNSISITLSATDLDGDALTYAIVSNPSQGTLSGTAPSITYTPNTNYNGTDSFTFRANDTQVNSNTATISLTINPINDAPVLNSIGNKSVDENSTLTFTVSGTDIDGDTLYYSIQDSPSGASFNSLTRTFTWTPSYTQSGTYTPTFTVSDTQLTDQETITITVNNVVTGPVCGDSICEGTETCSTCEADCGTCETSGEAIYVDNQLTIDCIETYSITNRNCSGTDGDAYNTLTEAANVAVAGDTVLIRSGTFSEQLRPANSGSAGNYISFSNYGNEIVTITGLSMAIDISNRDYIIIDGLTITNVASILRGHTSNYNIISNNVFSENTGSGTTGGFKIINAHYNKILNNTFFDIDADSLTIVDSDYNLVEGNNMSRASHQLWSIYCGNYNIIRNNYFENDEQKIGSILDCAETFSDAPYELDATKHNLVENNIFALTSTYYATTGGNGIQYAAQDGIVRRNIFYRNNVGLAISYYADESQYIYNNSVYHNVFYDNFCAGISLREQELNNIYKNNILFWNKGISGDCFGTGPAQLVYRYTPAGFYFERNNIINQVAGENVIHQEFGVGSTLSYYESNYPSLFVNNLEVDPGFVDAVGYDFNLDFGSQMIDNGIFLTTTVGAGSGVNLIVVDARYFYDGFGIPGEIGDLIQLDGQTTTARIVNVNYATNTLTLDTALTWTAGLGVSLAYEGNAPDIGAYEYQGGAFPTNNPPVLGPIGSKSVTVDNVLQFTATATDPNGDTFAFTAQNLPSGAVFTSDGFFSWIPSQTGTYNVTIIVSDGQLTDSETITITVESILPTPVCGDGTCNGTETCSTCEADCGTCSPITWTPPIGIPAPSFGIEETYRMYDIESNRNPALTYTMNSESGYYTHYVDNFGFCTDYGGNDYGTEANPRCSIPTNLPEGSVVEIHNSTDPNWGSAALIDGVGTAQRPIFVRGIDMPRLDFQGGMQIGFYGNARYIIVEGISFFKGSIIGREGGTVFDTSYIAVRNSDFYGDETNGGFGISSWTSNSVNNVVLYNNVIHDNGIWDPEQATGDNDIGGITIGKRSSNIWIVDNEMYYNEYDGIQISAGNGEPSYLTHHIYVGRNIAHHNKQSGFWVKNAQDVIFSENIAYGHIESSSGSGSGMGYQYDPQRIWYLFNNLYDNTRGFKSGSSNIGTREDMYIIGNVVHDVEIGIEINDGCVIDSEMILGNTIYNVTTGIHNDYYTACLDMSNNIIANVSGYHISFGPEYGTGSVSNIGYTLFDSPVSINWDGIIYNSVAAFQSGESECLGCAVGDPLFADVANGDFHLSDGSPAIDNGTSSGVVQEVFDRFEELYGIDIRKDIEGRTRPQGAEWDIGAYESGASPARISQTDDTTNEKLNNLASVLSSIRSAVEDILEKILNLF